MNHNLHHHLPTIILHPKSMMEETKTSIETFAVFQSYSPLHSLHQISSFAPNFILCIPKVIFMCYLLSNFSSNFVNYKQKINVYVIFYFMNKGIILGAFAIASSCKSIIVKEDPRQIGLGRPPLDPIYSPIDDLYYQPIYTVYSAQPPVLSRPPPVQSRDPWPPLRREPEPPLRREPEPPLRRDDPPAWGRDDSSGWRRDPQPSTRNSSPSWAWDIDRNNNKGVANNDIIGRDNSIGGFGNRAYGEANYLGDNSYTNEIYGSGNAGMGQNRNNLIMGSDNQLGMGASKNIIQGKRNVMSNNAKDNYVQGSGNIVM